MILKALKVLPFLAGSFNAPVLDNPKRANDTPIQTLSFGDNMYSNYANNTYTNTEHWTSPDNYEWEAYNYEGYDSTTYNYATYEFKTQMQSFWSVNNARTQGMYPTIWLGGNNTKYVPYVLSMAKISNITALIKDDVTISVDLEKIWEVNKSLNFNIYTYISYGNQTNIWEWDIYSDNFYIYNQWNTLLQNPTVTKIYDLQTTITAFNVTTIEISRDILQNYTFNSNQPIYLFTIIQCYTNTANDYDYMNYPNRNRVIITPSYRDRNIYNIVENLYATTVTQEVIDIPGLMFTVLTMPFSFISQAFNLTIFPGTQYAVNISNLFLALIAILIFALIMKIILGFIK